MAVSSPFFLARTRRSCSRARPVLLASGCARFRRSPFYVPLLSKSLALRNDDGRSLFHVAVSSARPEVVKFLSAVLNSADEEGWAPIHSVASIGNKEIMEILLSEGVDINLKNNGGRMALHYAASKGWMKIAELLITHGAKINAKNQQLKEVRIDGVSHASILKDDVAIGEVMKEISGINSYVQSI